MIDDIKGQEQAKRAALIAVAGRHNILLSRPPGSGKTMLAKALKNLLGAPSNQEIVDITKLHNLATGNTQLLKTRPFRQPHHSASRTSIIGGGTKIQPGEISLAHHGVLFLDELLEYPRSTLEALRQPLEDTQVTISRANGTYTYPANFILVATMNPCPCGYLGDNHKPCVCSSSQILQYQKRLSGPLLDRIDLTVTVSRVGHGSLLSEKSSSNKQHKQYKNLIHHAQLRQNTRYNCSDKYNGDITTKDVANLMNISPAAEKILQNAATKLDLSARSYFKAVKVARTIADLENSNTIEPSHIAESLQYRQIMLSS